MIDINTSATVTIIIQITTRRSIIKCESSQRVLRKDVSCWSLRLTFSPSWYNESETSFTRPPAPMPTYFLLCFVFSPRYADIVCGNIYWSVIRYQSAFALLALSNPFIYLFLVPYLYFFYASHTLYLNSRSLSPLSANVTILKGIHLITKP